MWVAQGSNVANHHKYFQRQTLFSQFYIWKKNAKEQSKKPKKKKDLLDVAWVILMSGTIFPRLVASNLGLNDKKL